MIPQPGMEDTLRFEQRHQAIIERFEQRHQAIIERFDRYPHSFLHTYAIHGRESMSEELAFLSELGSGF